MVQVKISHNIIALLLSVLCLSGCEGNRYVAFSGYAQGGVYTVKLNMRGVRQSPEQIRAHVDSLLEQIDFSLSGYNKASLLSRLNSGERIRPDSLLIRVYNESYKYYEASGGAFDIAAGPLFDVWGFGFKSGSFPEAAQIEALLRGCGTSRLRPTMEEAVGEDGMLCAEDLLMSRGAAPVLNFNAIAQGFTSDVIAEYLRGIGVTDMLVDIGEIFCSGRNPSGGGWSVGIDAPIDGNDTPGAQIEGVWNSEGRSVGIVTSGNYRKFYIKDGKKYAHTVDPRTGYPVQHGLLSATVVAPNATAADAMATACMVLGPDAARELILSDPSLEACLILDGDSTWTSPGFILKASK